MNVTIVNNKPVSNNGAENPILNQSKVTLIKKNLEEAITIGNHLLSTT